MELWSGSSDDGDQQPTSSMIEFLDLKRISKHLAEESTSDISVLSLNSFCVPPTPGMELIDVSSVSLSEESIIKRCPILDIHGADAAINLTSLNQVDAATKQNPRVAIALPDGTIGFFSSSPNTVDAVGIAEESHQFLLSYPAIGSGLLQLSNDDFECSGTECYVAYCLRGGTCYLIPTNHEKSSKSITIINFPQDIASDLSDVYIQSFTAGNLCMNGQLLPVLLFAWPNGVVDIYSCELLHPKPNLEKTAKDLANPLMNYSRRDRNALQDMIDNGTVELLLKISKEVRHDTKQQPLQTEEWKELLKDSKYLGDNITLEQLCSKENRNLCKCLLAMAIEKNH
jgi:hypothetical protein